MLMLLGYVIWYYAIGLLVNAVVCTMCIIETTKNGVPFKAACKAMLPKDWTNIKSILIDSWSWPIIVFNLIVRDGWAYVCSMIKQDVEKCNKD